MHDSPDSEKKPMENGLRNESEDSGNTSEQDSFLQSDDLKNKKEMDTDIPDSKHLDTEMIKQNKKRHNVNKKQGVSMWAGIKNSFALIVASLKKKSGLSNVGLVIAIILVLLLVISCVTLIVLGIIWPTIPHEMRFPVCRRSACLRSSSEILPKMNSSINPCEDFEGFACGRWLQSHPQPPADKSEWSLKRLLEFKTRDRLRQLILTQPYPIKVSSFAYKIKYLYEACMDLNIIDNVQFVPLNNHISALGGWNVLRDFQVHSFDRSATFTRLHSTLGVNLFIKVDVVPDPRNVQDNIIQILPADLGLPDKSYYYRPHNSMPVEAYKRFLKDVTQLLGATSSDAASFSEDMFFFEKRLSEIMPDKRDLHPLQAANKMSVGELKDIAPVVPLHHVLLSKYPEGNIEDSTPILVPYPEYLRNISNLISTTDGSSLNNYMMWKLTEKFLPYLSEKVRAAVTVYRRDMFGEKEPLPRWEFCIKTLQEFMGFGLAVFLQNHAENFEKNVKAVEDVYSYVMRQTKRSVGEASWLPVELHEHINGKLMTMSLEVGFPTSGTLVSDESLDEMYREMFVINKDFFQCIKNGISFLQKQQQSRLKKLDEIYRWMDAASSFEMKVHYIAASNKVVVPQALVQEPFFHLDYPLPVLLGNLGVEIASAIVQSISPWDVLYADGTLIDHQHPAVIQSEQAFFHPVYCLRRWWGKEGFASPDVSNQTSYNTLIRLSGVKIALKALEEQLKHKPHMHQPALENYEDQHLFFITFAQSVCSIKSPQESDVQKTVDVTLDGKALISVILPQVKEFTKLFSCSSENIFYTEIPCEDVL